MFPKNVGVESERIHLKVPILSLIWYRIHFFINEEKDANSDILKWRKLEIISTSFNSFINHLINNLHDLLFSLH